MCSLRSPAGAQPTYPQRWHSPACVRRGRHEPLAAAAEAFDERRRASRALSAAGIPSSVPRPREGREVTRPRSGRVERVCGNREVPQALLAAPARRSSPTRIVPASHDGAVERETCVVVARRGAARTDRVLLLACPGRTVVITHRGRQPGARRRRRCHRRPSASGRASARSASAVDACRSRRSAGSGGRRARCRSTSAVAWRSSAAARRSARATRPTTSSAAGERRRLAGRPRAPAGACQGTPSTSGVPSGAVEPRNASSSRPDRAPSRRGRPARCCTQLGHR